MTDVDVDQFTQAYRHMAARLGKAADGTACMDAFADVRHYPLAVVVTALEHLGKTCRFMPRPVQVIDACGDAARTHATHGGDVPADINHALGVFACPVCEDTGFERRLACPGVGVCHMGHCGHEGQPNTAHAFTRRCACCGWNPVLARERDVMRRPADGDRT
ncbi:MAG: hypothetical protein NTY02_19500 [Acidobacteria bacterium]|nr:hypothetical protein [Acidobacteriota bacterium]